MRKILSIGLFLLASLITTAQQEGQFTQFMFNQLNLNPAYAGSRGIPTLQAIYRGQWLGFDNAPRNILASFNTPVFADRVGFGLSIANQSIGVTNTWYVTMAYSYHIAINDNASLRFGLQGNLRQLSIDFSDPSVVIKQSGDPSILENMVSNQFTGNVGTGIYFSTKHFYAGVSVPYLYPSEIGLGTANLTAKESPHFYFMTGGLVPIGTNVDLKPSALVKYVKNAPLDVDFNLSLVFKKALHAGISYRLGRNNAGESVDLTAFYQINHVGFGIGYDYLLSDIKEFSGGSIEALVRYDFIKERQDMANPRFFY